jgi:hypothetical protein
MAGVGEALGAIGLAALFSTCVECFGYFKASQRMEKDLDVLLVKLDIEKTRLLIWGNRIGILDIVIPPNEIFSDPVKLDLTRRTLMQIESLLSDADHLAEKYGLVRNSSGEVRGVSFVSSNNMVFFRTAKKRLWTRDEFVRKLPLVSKTKWAIHEREAFQGLVNNLKDLIDGLYAIIPVSIGILNSTVEADIRSIDNIDQVRLFEAATEDSYRAWSAVASSVIEQSETGTFDNRSIDEQLSDESSSSTSLDRHLSTSFEPPTMLADP